MTQKDPPRKAPGTAETREDRLKQALKANLARRKAQMRARGAAGQEKDQDQEQDKGK